MEKGLQSDKSALLEIQEKYGFPAAAIVTMADVREYPSPHLMMISRRLLRLIMSSTEQKTGSDRKGKETWKKRSIR